jgi:proteasome accessory factor C
MDLFDRIFRLHQILSRSRYPVTGADIRERLECSRATFTRMIRDMRNYLGAPIEYDRKTSGYYYAPTGEHPYELPGLWFNASELHALLSVQQLLSEAQPGLLEGHIAPLRKRIEQILKNKQSGKSQVENRVRILRMAGRKSASGHFAAVAGAVLKRKRLHIRYHGRQRDTTTERAVSPQRLVHYRDNWYLDAWDHTRRALRSFSVDRILKARTLDARAVDISDKKLDAYFGSAYGIFSGRADRKAVLRFTAERSKWVADEVWHPKQKGRFENGHYVLEVPYSDSRELVMDILKHGPEVEVISPPALRTEVRDKLEQARAHYGGAESVMKKRFFAGRGGKKKR